MINLVNFGARSLASKLFSRVVMSKNSEKVYYAVGRGKETGIYESWKECKEQIDGVANAKYRKFFSIDEANEFVEFWKNYESPSKDTEDTVSSKNESKIECCDAGIDPPKYCAATQKKTFVLGLDTPEKPTKSLVVPHYTSPFAWSQVYCDYTSKQKNNFRRKRSNAKKTRDISLNGSGNYRMFNRSQSLNLTNRESDVQLVVDPRPVVRNTKPEMISETAKTIKTEVVEVEQESIGDSAELSVIDKASSCLDTLKQATKQPTKDFEKVINQLKILLQALLSDNAQVEVDGGTRSTADESQKTPERSPAPAASLQTPTSSSRITDQHLNHSFERSVDVMALSLRLDAFEKRFDSCLKEIGAIVSEISNIKSELKEIREGGGSKYSPRKSKEGLLQTTLNFKQNYLSKDEKSEFQNSVRSYGTMPEKKAGKSLKRKLSRSDSESSKRKSDGGLGEDEDDTDSLVSRIKTESVDYTSFNVDVHEYVEVYTDGACHSNGKNGAKAGIGIWFGDGHPLNVAEPVVGSPTNNSAEIQAARIAIELAIKAGISKLKILTDSEFLINCATKWVHKWKKNGWTLVNGGPVKNRKELEKLDAVASKILVRWEKVEAHTGIKGNEMADKLANEGAARYCR